MNAEHAAVRRGVPVLLVASCVGATLVSLHTDRSEIPSLAFGSPVILAVQIALVFFYGALLLLVPVVRALDGDLPIELSLRGARWTEELRDVGGDFTARQAKAEARALQAIADRKEEIRLQRQELREVEQALEVFTDQATKRIAAFEEKVMSRGSQD